MTRGEWDLVNSLVALLRDLGVPAVVKEHFDRLGNAAPAELLRPALTKVQHLLLYPATEGDSPRAAPPGYAAAAPPSYAVAKPPRTAAQYAAATTRPARAASIDLVSYCPTPLPRETTMSEPEQAIAYCPHDKEPGWCLQCLYEEVHRLKAGRFTEEEFQNLCHTFSQEDACRFAQGCVEYNRKLFGGKSELRELAALAERCELWKALCRASEMHRELLRLDDWTASHGRLAAKLCKEINDLSNGWWRSEAMSEPDLLAFLLRVLRAVNSMDCEELYWRTDGEYAPVTFFVNCNDLFWWGTADGERVTPENVAILEAANADAYAAGGSLGRVLHGQSLFCARVRKMRPQGCCYPDDMREMWPLFDKCGPERETGRDNPYRPGEREDRERARAAKE